MRRKSLSTNPKILITNAYKRRRKDEFDSATVNIPRLPRFSWPTRHMSYALRFIKQNVPEIEIMEYPSWQAYTDKLSEGWDVVGFTGFNYELGELAEMASEARRQGVGEIWSGSYMALSPEAEAFSDRIWVGYAEERLAELFGRKLDRIFHPPLIMTIFIDVAPGISIPYKTLGTIFTQRGCPYKCTFCQTPYYCPHPYKLPLESVAEVLRYYHEIGVDEVAINDENFGQFRKHSEAVVEMLKRYNMRWWTDSRADLIRANFDYWTESGLSLTVYGVESVRPGILDKMKKRTTVEAIRDLESRLGEKGVFTIATYILGHEDDTVDSVLADMVILRNIGFDIHQITVLTPFPKTELWDTVEERYGIFDRKPSHYNTRHLVWNHPHISPLQMKYLMQFALGYLNVPLGNYGLGVARMAYRRLREDGVRFLWKEIIKPLTSFKKLRYSLPRFLPYPRGSVNGRES